MAETRRDLMAPDSEPTDEELAIVMREALESRFGPQSSFGRVDA
jgi:hypothetical protein